MAINQSIRTRLFPIQGLELVPVSPEGDILLGADVPMNLALVAGRAPQGTALLSLADDGSLKVAVQGAGLSSYSYADGTTEDDYSDGATQLFETPQAHFTVAISTAGATMQIRNPGGLWGAEWKLKDGDIADYDLQATGFRFKSTASGSAAAWTLITLA